MVIPSHDHSSQLVQLPIPDGQLESDKEGLVVVEVVQCQQDPRQHLLGSNKVMKVCPGKVGAGVAGATSHEWTKVHPELIGGHACLILALCVFTFYPTAAIQRVGEDQHGVPLRHHVWKGAVKDI